MEAIHKLRVECPYEILNIEDIKIQCRPNEHGYLNMKCLIDDTINFNYAIKASTEDKICIYEEIDNGEEKSIIFTGLIQNVRTTNVNGIYYLEIDAVTSSFLIDIEEKSRSFQDTEMTYYDVIEKILKDYKGLGYGRRMDKPQKIGRPLFQYKESDFNFIKRLASELGIDLVCDIMKFSNMFYFGRPQDEEYALEEINYRVYKDLKKCQKTKAERRTEFHDTDFLYYEVEKREKMNIGDKVEFKGKDLYVNQFTAKFHQGELIYCYKLCRENGIWQEKIDNEKLKGISLEGKIIAVKDELVKLHLDIDKEQSEDNAYWFTFAPPTGNVMYSMPIVGTNALLYFPNVNKENPIVIGCVRKNGGNCDKFSDVNKRYYTTEHKNQLAMIPQSISFVCSGKSGLSVTLDDDEGVTLKSDKNLTLTATNEVIIKTDTKIVINGTNKLEVQRENEQAGISLENDMYCFGDIVHENGTSTELFASCSSPGIGG